MNETPDVTKRHKSAPKSPRKNKHRGVRLLAPDASHTSWRVRRRDPETGRLFTQTLSPEDARNADTRAAYATRLHSEVRRRNEDIRAGASPHKRANELVSVAINSYFDNTTVKADTRAEYRAGADAFLAWSDVVGIVRLRDLTPGMLARFPAWLSQMPKQACRGKRGAPRTGETISKHTANKHLASVKAILNELRRLEAVRLSRDQISDSLRRLKASVELKPFLRPAQIRMLLDTAGELREFFEFLLFTGCRLEEALGLVGDDVHVETGEIIVRAEIAKHGLARSLDVSHSATMIKRLPELSKRGKLFALRTNQVYGVVRRLIKAGAPPFSAHTLRRTCGTYIANGPWSVWYATKLLGHRSVMTAEKHYLGTIKVSAAVKSLEEAMGLESSAAVST